MRLREKLAIIFFTFIIIPMFLLWARWQGTAVGSIKSVMRQGLSDRDQEVSEQITVKLQNHQTQLINLTRDPAFKAYAQNLGKNPQALPDKDLQAKLAAFVLGNQQKYASLIGIN